MSRQMANVDAMALVSARHNYKTRADAFDREAETERNPAKRAELKQLAKLARKAATADLVNPDNEETP